MRVLLFISLIMIGIGCTTTKNTTLASGKLNGTWVPIKQEMGGILLPDAALNTQKLVLLDSTYTFIAESIDKGIVRYSDKDDKMDIYGKEGVNAGKHYTAIYKYETTQLTICYNLAGGSYPESYETKGKPLYFLSIFKKAQ